MHPTKRASPPPSARRGRSASGRPQNPRKCRYIATDISCNYIEIEHKNIYCTCIQSRESQQAKPLASQTYENVTIEHISMGPIATRGNHYVRTHPVRSGFLATTRGDFYMRPNSVRSELWQPVATIICDTIPSVRDFRQPVATIICDHIPSVRNFCVYPWRCHSCFCDYPWRSHTCFVFCGYPWQCHSCFNDRRISRSKYYFLIGDRSLTPGLKRLACAVSNARVGDARDVPGADVAVVNCRNDKTGFAAESSSAIAARLGHISRYAAPCNNS
jgi:hypothetical protein